VDLVRVTSDRPEPFGADVRPGRLPGRNGEGEFVLPGVAVAQEQTAAAADLHGLPSGRRHSFVSLLSDSGTPLENIARLCGHRSTTVTETIYRHQIRPVIDEGATVMDQIFPQVDDEAKKG
jgi:integrase